MKIGVSSGRLANTVRLDARLPRPGSGFRRGFKRNMPHSLAQGTLVDLIFEKIQIDPNTSVKEIIKFREDHVDELGDFRTKIAELTNAISSDLPENQLYQKVNDVYINEVRPALNKLKDRLKENKIKHATEGFLRVISLSTIPIGFLKYVTGLSVPVALLVDIGISLTACAILYNPTRNEILRQNPYSYLLAMKKEVGRVEK